MFISCFDFCLLLTSLTLILLYTKEHFFCKTLSVIKILLLSLSLISLAEVLTGLAGGYTDMMMRLPTLILDIRKSGKFHYHCQECGNCRRLEVCSQVLIFHKSRDYEIHIRVRPSASCPFNSDGQFQSLRMWNG